MRNLSAWAGAKAGGAAGAAIGGFVGGGTGGYLAGTAGARKAFEWWSGEEPAAVVEALG